jgi:hypothetical protein
MKIGMVVIVLITVVMGAAENKNLETRVDRWRGEKSADV